MRTLELFAGTQSFTKGIKRHFPEAECLTLDSNTKFNPSFHTDIMKWDYKTLPPLHFDMIWCSPPCDQYSAAKTRGGRDLEKADAFVRKCFEIIDYFQPKTWILENSGTGLLPSRMLKIRELPSPFIADYCAYGTPYRKRTAFWSNQQFNFKKCSPECPSLKDGRHVGVIGGTGTHGQRQVRNLWERGSVPESLINDIIAQIGCTPKQPTQPTPKLIVMMFFL